MMSRELQKLESCRKTRFVHNHLPVTRFRPDIRLTTIVEDQVWYAPFEQNRYRLTVIRNDKKGTNTNNDRRMKDIPRPQKRPTTKMGDSNFLIHSRYKLRKAYHRAKQAIIEAFSKENTYKMA